MSKWYVITTTCEVLTDYIVWADSEEEARDKMYEQEHTHETDRYGFINKTIHNVKEVSDEQEIQNWSMGFNIL